MYDSNRCSEVESRPDFKAAGISLNCSTPTSSNGTLGVQETTAVASWSFPRRPFLRACSHSNAAGVPPSRSLTPPGRQSWRWEGENGPRNCLKIVPLLVETLDTLRMRRRLPLPAVSVMQSLNCAGPNNSAWQGLRLLQKETLKLSVNTYGRKRLNHNIAQFLQLLF